MKTKTLFFAVFALLFAACSSPESDGKKAARQMCDCKTEYSQNREKSYTELNDNLDSYHFETRNAVREKLAEIDDKLAIEFQHCQQKATAQYAKFRQRYAANYQKNSEFEYAYQNYQEINELQENRNPDQINKSINAKILSIIPPKPDVEKLKKDLTGRKISDMENGWHRQDWYHEVKQGDIQEIEIKNERKQDKDFVFSVRLLLQKESSGQEEAIIKVTYVLQDYDDWRIDFLETESLNIVQTHKYDNCITTQRIGWSYEYKLEITNRCDVALIVGGYVLSEQKNEWQKFTTVVSANETKSVGGLFSVSVLDYKIEFIERP
jgi:Skp family chaperone for outer membrane proteins